MPHERWTINTTDGAFGAYVAKPEGAGPWPAIVVLQEIFGVNKVMRDACDRLAAQNGYLSVCPDLFWRIDPNIDITDQTDAEWKQAMELFGRFDADKGVEDIAATITEVRASPECNGAVGTVGYCLGGLLAFLTATRTDSDATVGYYAVGLDNRLGEADRLSHPLMLHIAEDDGFVSKDAQARIKAALANRRGVEIHSYPGRDHAFARPGGKNFNAEDATLANERTAAFFKGHLG
jgi:carboxymethylenebutenolidase